LTKPEKSWYRMRTASKSSIKEKSIDASDLQ